MDIPEIARLLYQGYKVYDGYKSKQDNTRLLQEVRQLRSEQILLLPVQTVDSRKLVGDWKCSGYEHGYWTEIVWQFNSDGSEYYQYCIEGNMRELYGFWRYSNGIIFEVMTQADNNFGMGAVRWLNSNHFELSIINNEIATYSGMKRNYYRQ